MVLQDAIFWNDSRKEPWWFSMIRRTVALALVCCVILFGISQLQNLSSFLDLPNIVIVEYKKGITYPGFIICPESVSPSFVSSLNESLAIPEAVPQFSITCGRSFGFGPELLSDRKPLDEPICEVIPFENGCLKFRPVNESLISEDGTNSNDNIDTQDPKAGFNKTFMFFNIKPNTPPIEDDVLSQVEIPKFYTIYFDDYQGHGRNFSIPPSVDGDFVEYNMFPITTGQRNILEYSVSIHRVYSTSLMGQLYTRPDKYSLEFKAETKVIPISQPNSQPTETQFILLPKIPHYLREEIEKYEYRTITVISNLGGFYGLIVAVYVAFFGMPKIEPWGILQKVLLRCFSSRRSFKNHLAERYVSYGGIPMGERVKDRPEGSSLEDRLQILECVLIDYYVDPYYLEKLKRTKVRYDNKEVSYQKFEHLVDLRDIMVENNRRIYELSDDEYSRFEERNHRARRWSNWSRRFGFRSRSANNGDNNIGATSVNSAYSISIPSPSISSPRRIRWSDWSFLNLGRSNHGEIDATSNSANSLSIPSPRRVRWSNFLNVRRPNHDEETSNSAYAFSIPSPRRIRWSSFWNVGSSNHDEEIGESSTSVLRQSLQPSQRRFLGDENCRDPHDSQDILVEIRN